MDTNSIEGLMIEDTLLFMGVDVFSLKLNSHKVVLWKCPACNTVYKKKFVGVCRFRLCMSCANKKRAVETVELRSEKAKDWHRNNNHPLLGTKRPLHVREALAKAARGRVVTEETRTRLRKAFSGSNNPFYGKKHPQEIQDRITAAARKNVRRGKESNFYGKKPFHGKGSWYEKATGEKIWMRSTWEVRYARYLDREKVEWLYEPDTFNIIYEGREGTYTPDFKVGNRYVEVKGFWRDDAFIKYTAFINQYPNLQIELMDKEKLKQLNVI